MDLRFFNATVIGIRALAPLVRELVLRMDEAAVFHLPPPGRISSSTSRRRAASR